MRNRWKVAGLVSVALVLRLYNLDAIPIAGDESVYLRWTEIILHQGQWFISLLDGKQPLQYWLYALSWWAWEDPLFAGRFVSALAGAGSTLGIWAIARRLGGERAGLLAAFLYAIFPYALLYDRLAYTESLVNLAGITIVYTSLGCFGEPDGDWKRALQAGLALGLGLFIKSTVVLFSFFPIVAAVWLARRRRTLIPLGIVYGVAAVFPLASKALVPKAPMMQTHSVMVHQTDFFVSPAALLKEPLRVAPRNLRLLVQYLAAYATWPLGLAMAAAVAYLAWRRSAGMLVVATVFWAPLLAQVFLLEKMYPTRYAFPHLWPLLVAVGIAAAAAPVKPLAAWLALGAVAGPAVYQSAGILRAPAQYLYREDAQTFLGSGPAAGYGIREAADFLTQEARRGPLTLFTDAIWGPPADSMFVYLNQRHGIQVYEAWWTGVSAHLPILPTGRVEIVKSQYERVAAGWHDPARLGRVYYITERHYNPPAGVRRRQPSAQLVASFPKPNGVNAIDVYRLR